MGGFARIQNKWKQRSQDVEFRMMKSQREYENKNLQKKQKNQILKTTTKTPPITSVIDPSEIVNLKSIFLCACLPVVNVLSLSLSADLCVCIRFFRRLYVCFVDCVRADLYFAQINLNIGSSGNWLQKGKTLWIFFCRLPKQIDCCASKTTATTTKNQAKQGKENE